MSFTQCFLNVSKSACRHLVYSRKYSATNAIPTSFSYSCGTSDTRLLGLTVGNAIDIAGGNFGDREAIVVSHQNVRRNFSQFKKEVDKLASGFLALGLKKGDRIGIWSANNYEWVLTQYASAKAGLILVNINPGYKPQELKYCLNLVGVRTLICSESFKSQNYYDMLTQLLPELPTTKQGLLKNREIPHLQHVVMITENNLRGTYRFSDIFDAGDTSHEKQLEAVQKTIQFDDAVNIQFTSGTTGNPKGATLTHHNIINNAYFVGRRLGLHQTAQRLILPVPLYHCFGCVVGSLAGVLHGACAVYPSTTFNSQATAKAIQEEKCTTFYGTPTMFVDILNLPNFKNYDFSSLRTGIMTGAPCPEELLKDTSEKMNVSNITVCYGCTETSPVILHSFPEDSLQIRSTTVGCTLPSTEVKIVDVNGNIVPRGAEGELWTRGYLVMLGYWNNDAKTKETITEDRWYKTGDIAVMDEKSYVKIVGRIKDMIIRGGENIYPREIEDYLYTHPKVAEVQVVGIPDKRLGEELCAWIRLKNNETLTENEVKDYCKENLARFKVPKHIIFEDNFPKTVTGKIKKFEIKEESIKRLGLQPN